MTRVLTPDLRPIARLLPLAAATWLVCASVSAQFRVAAPPEQGAVGLELALRRASTPVTALIVLAHPDDEDNALVVALARSLGARVVVCTATRGEGGQNEIGPELWGALALIRTGELLGARRIDGGEQRFLRAVDFGYSFSIEETLAKWGRERMLADIVTTIRRERPDVIITMWPDGAGGGQHHQTIARLTREAFDLAGNAAQFAEDMKSGLVPWTPKALWHTRPSRDLNGRAIADPPSLAHATTLTVDLSRLDPVLGTTPAELGGAARSLHKSQGFGLLLPVPANATARFELAAGTARIPRGEGDPVALFADVPVSLEGLLEMSVRSGMPEVAARAAEARVEMGIARARGGLVGPLALRSLSESFTAAREWQALLMAPVAFGYEPERATVADRLERLVAELRHAASIAAGLRLAAISDDGMVVPGDPLKITLSVGHSAQDELTVRVTEVSGLMGPDSAPTTRPNLTLSVPPSGSGQLAFAGTVAELSTTAFRPGFDPRSSTAYRDVPRGFPWWLGFPESEFRVRGTWSLGELTYEFDVPVQYRDAGDVYGGEKRHDVAVVTPIGAQTLTPWLVRRVSSGQGRVRSPQAKFLVTAASKSPSTAPMFAGPTGVAELAGWGFATVLRFTGEDRTITVPYSPPFPRNSDQGGPMYNAPIKGAPREQLGVPETQPTDWSVDSRPASEADALKQLPPSKEPPNFHVAMPRGTGMAGWRVVEPAHLPRRILAVDPGARWVDGEVAVDDRSRVGYVMGVGDLVQSAIDALGVTCDLLTESDLAFGDLSRYSTIMIGVRAYERRPDLRAHNARLLDYVASGGVMVVQFQRGEFDREQWGPVPARTTGGRVTDESAPLVSLASGHRLLTTPNLLTGADADGWVQERGLYFLDTDAREAIDVLACTDSFPLNPGTKRGLLTEIPHGKGRWIYCGLGLFRQLPAGVPGAYRFLANLIAPIRVG